MVLGGGGFRGVLGFVNFLGLIGVFRRKGDMQWYSSQCHDGRSYLRRCWSISWSLEGARYALILHYMMLRCITLSYVFLSYLSSIIMHDFIMQQGVELATSSRSRSQGSEAHLVLTSFQTRCSSSLVWL